MGKTFRHGRKVCHKKVTFSDWLQRHCACSHGLFINAQRITQYIIGAGSLFNLAYNEKFWLFFLSKQLI